ncbi:substrate-binding domain-containing protein [Streptomyces sp. Y1]|uniref:Substrate-binding domain-containing protein n=1 Tax=Streptomyces sp. Y1 TaxID=3238634 RepID=A0AB39TFN7_9ACTN
MRADGRGAVRDLVAHLHRLGHRRLAIIGGPAATTTGQERVAAFREALAEYGLDLPDRYVGQGDFQADSGRRATERFLDLAEPPQVVFAADNLMALGALDAVRARGLRVPDDIALDNVAGGEQAAKALAEKLGGSGKIVILQGLAGTSAARERAEGFAKELAAYPGIEVVAQQPADFDRTKGLDVMSNLLQAHPDVRGVIAANDEMALGAARALGSEAGDSVQVVGFDGTPDGLKAVEQGTLYASVAQQPSQLGKIAVDNAVKAIEGEKVEETIKVPVKVVTKETVAGFSG